MASAISHMRSKCTMLTVSVEHETFGASVVAAYDALKKDGNVGIGKNDTLKCS